MSSGMVDVAIVGAGAGGLRAAVRLQEANVRDNHLDVTVLEARDRVGGRLLSPTIVEGRIDLGATWFWANEPLINELIITAGLVAFPQHLDGDMMFQNNGVQQVSGNQLDSPSGRLAEGMQSVANVLADRLLPGTIELGQAVRSIRLSGAGLTVATARRTIEAQHVVLAIPPALAVATIDFGDELSAPIRSVAAATPVWMGATTKVVAVFGHAFWRDAGLAGSAFSYDGPMREIHDMSGPNGHPAALFGFCSISPGAAAPTREAVTEQLVALFGPQAASPVEIHVMDWRAEPHTIPAAAVGLANYQTYGHAAFQEPAIDGRLHWASTETSPTAPGHIEGALVAADRAAATIIRSTT